MADAKRYLITSTGAKYENLIIGFLKRGEFNELALSEVISVKHYYTAAAFN
jgi:hypothetical protein